MKQYPFEYVKLARELNRMARGLMAEAKERDKSPHSNGLAQREAAQCLRRAARRILLMKDGRL